MVVVKRHGTRKPWLKAKNFAESFWTTLCFCSINVQQPREATWPLEQHITNTVKECGSEERFNGCEMPMRGNALSLAEFLWLVAFVVQCVQFIRGEDRKEEVLLELACLARAVDLGTG